MDPARAADMSWPSANYQFHRPWNPPDKQKRPRPAPEANSKQNHNTAVITLADAAAQRAFDFAMARAASLDRLADALLHLGRHRQAERLAHRAADLRQAVAEAPV